MKFPYTKALVTGGAGFIGSHLVEALVTDGCHVTVVDDLSSGHLENLAGVKEQIAFRQGDIRDLDFLQQACRGCDVVFHLAAVVSVTKTVEDPIGSTQVNDLGALNVLEAARRCGIDKVILSSSSAVYGDDPQLPKLESMTVNPLSPYAVQKRTNEQYARLFFRLYGLKTCCLRYFNVFGPRQDPSSPYSGVISIFMTKARQKAVPIVYGDGRQTRDFVFVADVVRANLAAATEPASAGEIFNIGTSNSVSINELWCAISRLAQCNLSPTYAEPRAGDVMHSLAGIRKARRLLNFQPAITLDEGLQLTYAWYGQTP